MGAVRKAWSGAVVGALLLLAGCGSEEPRVVTPARTPVTLAQPSVATPPPEVAITAGPVDEVTGVPASTTAARPSPPPTPATGTIVLRTETVSGVAVPAVPVHLSRQEPCDPAAHDIPVGETTETQRFDAVTDGDGRAAFTVSVGCYYFGMTAPAGTNPVPEGMHSAFLTAAGSTVDGLLRFQDSAGPCHPDGISADLGVLDNAAVIDCDGTWAVVRFATPGDNQRIIRRVDGTWTTYLLFPHETCWDTAESDGVPARLRPYFSC
ncbi:hypothetical protein [Nocardia caishijiensis]|uniref:Uncharacterized protein n=1 Tax=Nocardia caishijiensis TaxID=184756 RepID=A0ABQ6YPR8_9NOCA|nr:hypothetical protein [Nocardia caishijiensis]KAF0847748.1 hypothetical protein FNL39_103650 [Nocardia caishijiensis]